MFYKQLQEKLIESGIPAELAQKYCMQAKRGLMPEFGFNGDKMPSDGCFKNLAVIYKDFYLNRALTIQPFEIISILSISEAQPEEAKQKISELFPEYADDIPELYKSDMQLYYLNADDAEYLCSLISDYINERDRQWQVFKKAAKVGVFCTESRFEAVEAAVGKQLASQVIYEATVNGYLLHPHYTDPIAAIRSLSGKFNELMIARILLENPDYLYLYKDQYFIEKESQKEEREKKIRNIVKKYE